MKISQRLLVSVALLVADSTWIYAAIAALGIVAVRDNPPLSWPWVLLVLSAGALTAAIGQGFWWRMAQAIIGLGVVYIAVASLPNLGGLEPLWIVRLLDGDFATQIVFSLVIALVAAAFVWRQGTLLGAAPFLEDRSVHRFRIGITVFALALLFEIGSGAALGTATLLIPFFSASLAAMALARLPDVTAAGRGWVFVLSTSVVLVIVLGLAAGLLAGAVGRSGASLLATGWSQIAGSVAEVTRLILVPILEVIFAVLTWLMGLLAGSTHRAEYALPDLLEPSQTGELSSLDWPLNLFPYALAVLILFFLYRALRPVVRRVRTVAHGRVEVLHESIRAEAQPLTDLARLLRLLFGLPTADKDGNVPWRSPSAEAGITETFQLYFYLLRAAIGRGHELQASATPLERIPSLCFALPGAPVEQITRCFNAACYGRSPSKVEIIRRLRARLDEAVNSE